MVTRAWRIASLVARDAISGPVADGEQLIGAARRILRAVVFNAILLIVSIPIFAFAQPLLPAYDGAAFMGALAGLLVLVTWRSASGLHRVVGLAGALLKRAMDSSHPEDAGDAHTVPPGMENIPGIGRVFQFRVEAGLHGVGKTIGELNLTGSTGAAVLAINRDATQVMVPAASEELRVGDTIVLGGSDQAIAAARRILLGGSGPLAAN